MRSVTDGELRRAWFHLDFLEQLGGVAVTGNIAASSDAADTVHMTPPRLSVVGPLRHVRDIQVDDFRYLRSVVTQTPKVSIPSPTMVHFRGGRAAIDIDAYPDLDAFFADLAACYRAEIDALYAAGCRYLQLDDTNLAYLCDPVMRAGAVERGDDPDALPHAYAELINAAIAGRPDDLTRRHPPVPRQLPQHVVRRGRVRAGRRGAVQRARRRRLLPRVRRRALRRLRPAAPCRQDTTVVLGLVTTKRPELEPYDELAARVAEAARYVPIDQLCLSPQCGFASTVEGNALTADEQWAKLGLVVDSAARIWA